MIHRSMQWHGIGGMWGLMKLFVHLISYISSLHLQLLYIEVDSLASN